MCRSTSITKISSKRIPYTSSAATRCFVPFISQQKLRVSEYENAHGVLRMSLVSDGGVRRRLRTEALEGGVEMRYRMGAPDGGFRRRRRVELAAISGLSASSPGFI